MNRKFLAGFLAASLVLTAAPVVPGMEVNADAEELSIGSQTRGGDLSLIGSSRAASDSAIESELTCGDFFKNKTKGVEVTETGVAVTFKSKTNSDQTLNWSVPSVIAYSGSEPVVQGTGYREYAYIRGDVYGWCGNYNNAPDPNNSEQKNWSEIGYNMVSSNASDFSWDTWVAENKAGVDCKLQAVKSNGKVYIEFTVGKAKTLTSLPYTENGAFYVSLSGEQCALSEISLASYSNIAPNEPEDPTDPPETEDPTDPPVTDNPPVTEDPVTPPVSGDAEILTGTAWWTGNQTGKNYSLKGDGTLDLFIGYIGGLPDGAFSVELVSDGNKFITTGSDINIWTAESATGEVSGGVLGGVVTPGHKYKVSVTRQGADFTIVYFDMTDNKEHCKLTATNTNMGEEVNIHVMAQIGKYMVNTADFDMPELNVTTPKPLAPYPIVLPTPEPLPTLPPADENATPEPTPVLEPETLTGTAWWDANEVGRNYVLSGAGSLDLYVTFESTSDSNGYGAFNVELVSDGNKYITTGSDTNAWTGEQGTGTITCPNLTNSTIVPGHVYKITVKRTNYDFTVTYYDLTDNKEYCTMEIKDTNQGIDVNVHVIAQVGKYIVSQKAPDSVTPSASATPAPSADPSASPDPSATAEPGSTEAPGTTDPGTNPGEKDPETTDPGTNNPAEDPSDDDDKKDKETKKTMKVSGITAKAGKKKVTGKLSVKGTKVTVKVGNKSYKNAKVNGKKFTFTASSKLKKGTKVTIKVTKSGYKAVTKTVKVK